MKETAFEGTLKSIKLAFLVIAIISSNNALAIDNYWELSQSDLQQLPPFCKHGFKGYGISPKEVAWLNHLCPGLNALNHAQQMVEQNQEKQDALNDARRHFSYTLTHTSEAMPLRSAVLLKRGLVNEMQGNIAAAISDYQAAIQLKPRQSRAYASLADLYIRLNRPADARDFIERGLKVKPKSKMLLRRLAKIPAGSGDLSE